MSQPHYERKMTPAKCNNCGHEFEAPAWHLAIWSSDLGVIGWALDSDNAFRGVSCPKCGSTLIGAQDR